MKAHLRHLGISKWPNRKRNTLHKLLRHAPDLQGDPQRHVSILCLPGICCLMSIPPHLPLDTHWDSTCKLPCHVSKLQGHPWRLQWVLWAFTSCCDARRERS